MPKKNLVQYRIIPKDLALHLFSVAVTIPDPEPSGQRIRFATWIPGSYLIRDFSQHIEQMKACDQKGRPLRIDAISHSAWQIEPSEGRITLSYLVYAWDLSVRTAHLDQHHGFFNGTSVFAEVEGRAEEPCLVDIRAPKDFKSSWRVYTSLNKAQGWEGAASRHGFGQYLARNYDDLIDHPVEMGQPQTVSFKAGGVEHEMVFTGLAPNLDLERIAQDCRKICQTQIDMFEPEQRRAPFKDSAERYVFLVMVTGSGYGGLEHRSSTALMIPRACLPVQGKPEMSTDYISFLGLVSHEYFHSWNVKRIKPQRFVPYDLSRATPTRLLWVFEGFTSYYDDLSLLRAGLINLQQYMNLLQKTINAVLPAPGAAKQSIAESSWDAGNKYYRPNENSPNSTVSYYTKGALTALCLDLHLRIESNQRCGLDHLMRHLWQKYGRDFFSKPQGLAEEAMIEEVREACGVDITQFAADYIDGVAPLPIAELLEKSGSAMRLLEEEAPAPAAWLGIQTKPRGEQLQISYVKENSPAHEAGLSGLDELVAIGGLKVQANSFKAVMARFRPGDETVVHVFRVDELQAYPLKFGKQPPTFKLVWNDAQTP